jgi:AraC-like DNA-binding protein
MFYLERKAKPPLSLAVDYLWYTRSIRPNHPFERVLPTGRAQVIINLARNYISQCDSTGVTGRSASSLIVGGRSACEVIDTSDLSDLLGIVFRPAGLPSFVMDSSDRFCNATVDLGDVWGSKASDLRDRLLEAATPETKLDIAEIFLLQNFGNRIFRNPIVIHALNRFSQSECGAASVGTVAAEIGISCRHLSQLFREQVGFPPKVWCRIQRFQSAVRQLHRGSEPQWATLAADCGYYDQSHFANEFRAFSEIDITTYKSRSGPWANHRPIE